MKLQGSFVAPEGIQGLDAGPYEYVEMEFVEDFCMFDSQWPVGVVCLKVSGIIIVDRMYVATLFDYEGSRSTSDIQKALLSAIKENANLVNMEIVNG